MEGPDQQFMCQSFSQVLGQLTAHIDDSTPRMKQVVSWFYLRLIDHQPLLVFSSDTDLKFMISKTLENLEQHQRISKVLAPTLKGFFEKAYSYDNAAYMNEYFSSSLQKLMGLFYRQDFIRMNMQNIPTYAMTEIL